MDCGVACLAMVCRHFGRAVSLSFIRRVVQANTEGTSLKALCRTATTLGLAARAVKAAPSLLAHLPLPAIVHWQAHHWVVLYDVSKRQVRLADPASGLRRLSRAAFEAHWTGYAALFDYTQAFVNTPEDDARLGRDGARCLEGPFPPSPLV
jgi:ATP-binding cassette subfamily B protein